MRILFIHQNFPGQFKVLAPTLKKLGHDVRALTTSERVKEAWSNIPIHRYQIAGKTGAGVHRWLAQTDEFIRRADGCMIAAMALRDGGWSPDVIMAHFGWGESLFLRDVWPEARLGLYCEFYYRSKDGDIGFDPEFNRHAGERDISRIRIKNINNILHAPLFNAGLSPTRFQADTFPKPFRDKISVIHEGIDTEALKPDPNAFIKIGEDLRVSASDEVITFINRNLEPYRGVHKFMRALPELLRRRPNARVLIIGGDQVSYGGKSPDGRPWREVFTDEVRGQIPDADWARVFFLGRIAYDHFIRVLQLSSVRVYLSYPFVLSWSVLESMSVGGTVLANDSAPVREVITHNETGRLIDFHDGDALVNEICALADDAPERARLGANARAFVVENYDLRTKCLPRQLTWFHNLQNLDPVPLQD